MLGGERVSTHTQAHRAPVRGRGVGRPSDRVCQPCLVTHYGPPMTHRPAMSVTRSPLLQVGSTAYSPGVHGKALSKTKKRVETDSAAARSLNNQCSHVHLVTNDRRGPSWHVTYHDCKSVIYARATLQNSRSGCAQLCRAAQSTTMRRYER